MFVDLQKLNFRRNRKFQMPMRSGHIYSIEIAEIICKIIFLTCKSSHRFFIICVFHELFKDPLGLSFLHS